MIHIVGAGPGAADLITVRGMRLLNVADVVIYVFPPCVAVVSETCV